MQITTNQYGGVTHVLRRGDSIDDLPHNYRNIVTETVRVAFEDPVSYFRNVAEKTSLSALSTYLARATNSGSWNLTVADAFLWARTTYVGFEWSHRDMYPVLFDPGTVDCSTHGFSGFFNYFRYANWGGLGCAGYIATPSGHVLLSDYGLEPNNISFPVSTTRVFATSPCGDAMVYNSDGVAGYVSHEVSSSYRFGEIAEMLDWIFAKLSTKELPEFNYNRIDGA